LAENRPIGDQTISLEIAWHLLRGGDVPSAVPFAIEGAEEVLAVGAPHGAEEILTALVNVDGVPPTHSIRVRLLLARALVDQSKFEMVSSVIQSLGDDARFTTREEAEIAMMRAAVEFGLNRDGGSKYCDLAKLALEAAKKTGQVKLISRALFECARAGTEEGLLELVQTAETGTDELIGETLGERLPMVVLTKAFCRFSFWDYEAAVKELDGVLSSTLGQINTAESCLLYSGLGIARYFLGHFQEAHDALIRSLGFANKLGDDVRVSQVASNLCAVELVQGNYDLAIEYGELGTRVGEACASSGLLPCYTNLMDSYLLVGRESEALQCLDNARKWLIPERRWKLRCAFLTEAASFALSHHNHALALDLIEQLETMTRGRERAVPLPGPYWKLRIFRESHTSSTRQAYDLARATFDRLHRTCPFHSLDVAATLAWLERKIEGRIREGTQVSLGLFDMFNANGKKALLILQGFLESDSQWKRNERGVTASTGKSRSMSGDSASLSSPRDT
jgi:tetratricopeptide (TPR) repeat protein